MLRIRTVGLALVAAFALSTVAVSAASAAQPEFKGPFPKPFTLSTGYVVFSVIGAITFECGSGGTAKGEITSGTGGTVTFRWTACNDGSGSLQSVGANQGEVVTEELGFAMGYINKTPHTEIGLQFEQKDETHFANLYWWKDGTQIPLEFVGGVIGRLLQAPNTLTNKFDLEFGVQEGLQVPEKFYDVPRATLKAIFGAGTESHPATMQSEDQLLTEELTEIVA